MYERGAVVLVLAAACIIVTTPSNARVATRCSFRRGVLKVRLSPGVKTTISRNDAGRIRVKGCRRISPKPNINKVRTIKVIGAGDGERVVIDERNGLFAPGKGAEAGSAEIELLVRLKGGKDVLAIRGTSGDDQIDIGTSGINLNADEDADITYRGIEQITLDGGSGNDLLSGGGGTGVGDAAVLPLSFAGRSGDDSLAGGEGNDALSGGDGNDGVSERAAGVVTLSASSLMANGTDALESIEQVSVETGDGDDTLELQGWKHGASFMAGDGVDRLRATADADMTLDDASLVIANGATVALSGVETASLTGGSSANTLEAGAFSGATTLKGLSGNDKLEGGPAADVLTGGDGNDELMGGAGTDSVAETADADFVVTSNSLQGLGTDTLVSIEAFELAGGSGANTLAIAGWSGAGTFDGKGGGDTLSATADGDMTVTDSSLVISGGTPLSITSVEEASLIGGPGANVLDASSFTGHATLDGAGANDALTGGSGDDSLTGGPGDDTMTGSGGTDELMETATNLVLMDTTITGLGNDTLASIEKATLAGTDGNDNFNAGLFTGTVALIGGPGDDKMVGSAAGASLQGGNGNDELWGLDKADSFDGGDGDDQIFSAGGNDDFVGGAGTDSFVGFDLTDPDADFTLTDTKLTATGWVTSLSSIEQASVAGGAGANTIDATAFTGSAGLSGGGGDDVLLGGPNQNFFQGDGDIGFFPAGTPGSDTISGGGGDDIALFEGSGSMMLTNTTFMMGSAVDTLSSIEIADLQGGDDGDQFDLSGWNGSATVDGELGSDSLVDTRDSDRTLVDSPDPGEGLLQYPGVVSIEFSDIELVSVNGGDQGNSIDASGYTLTSVITYGYGGNDVLMTGSKNDYLEGGPGNDRLVGGGGDDLFTGGLGSDQFECGPGNDTLNDFDMNLDTKLNDC